MPVTVLSYDIKCDREGNYPPVKEYLIENFSYRQTTNGEKSMIAMPNSTLMKYGIDNTQALKDLRTAADNVCENEGMTLREASRLHQTRLQALARVSNGKIN